MTSPLDTASVPSAAAPVSLYVHVPFCVSKCAYCDFYSETGAAESYARFVDAALFEAGHWSHYDLLDDVETLYLGGGTPTLLGSEVVRLLEGLRQTARLRPEAEITVETNPETTTPEIVAALLDAGTNRFSLGVQSFDDSVLRTLGRCHDAASARTATRTLELADVAFSIDLICGVPGQSYASWDADLEQAVSCGARHVSVYPLSLEPGTPMDSSVREGSVPAPDPDVAADMMLAAEVALAAAGMPRYEVANYAQPGFESRHNSVYWTGGAYLGVGPHASSMLPYSDLVRVAEGEGWSLGIEGAPPARARISRDVTLAAYLRAPLAMPGPIEFLTQEEVAREDVMLGMRLTRGVDASQVEGAGLTGVMRDLAASGLVTRDADADGTVRWRTTQRGWLLGNRVYGAIWSGK